MSKFKELTKKKGFRIAAAGIGLIGVLTIVQSGLNWQEDAPTPKKVRRELIESNVFDTNVMQKVETEQAEATYEQMKKELKSRNDDMAAQREAQKKELDKVMTQLAKMQSQLSTQNQVISVLTRNNQIVAGQVQDPRVTRASETGLTGNQTQGGVQGGAMGQGPYSNVQPQYQNVSRSRGPETNGMIRTVSQNRITNIKKTGEVEETPIEVVYVEKKGRAAKPDTKEKRTLRSRRKSVTW